MNRKRNPVVSCIGAVVAFSAIAIAATGSPPGGVTDNQCCFTKCCPDGHGGTNCATNCISGCPSGKVCSGHGTCSANGTPTAVAECISQP